MPLSQKKFLKSVSFAIIFYVLILGIPSLFATEPYQNINGFYGERAAGLGGAYTAISDDPSGAYYNPAGLAFSFNDGFSISASNFKNTERKYKNIDTPGQVYTQQSSGFDPNFVGILKSFNSWKFGFSIVNTYNTNYDRADQVNFPLVSPTINQTRNFSKEKYSQILVGPSFAFLITPKLSFGLTLYYLHDTKNIARTQFQQFSDFSYVMRTFIDNRQTNGLMPIVGFQYQMTDKISFGLSMRKILVTGGNRLYNEVYTDSLRSAGSNAVDFIEGTDKGFTGVESGVISKRPNLVSSIPETSEIRFGTAFFPTSRFLVSFDTIYHSGYKKRSNQDTIRVLGSRVNYIVQDSEIRELTRVSTLNFAYGMEYYIADTFSILLGGFTNEPNTKPISWTESAFDIALQNSIQNQFALTSGDNSLTYQLARSGTNPRNEYSRNRGFSLGCSWLTSKSSISLTYIREFGFGNSRIDPNSLSQSFEYSAHSLYVMVSSRN